MTSCGSAQSAQPFQIHIAPVEHFLKIFPRGVQISNVIASLLHGRGGTGTAEQGWVDCHGAEEHSTTAKQVTYEGALHIM